ncbi:MAG: hypothetical protein KatS3mg115_0370 [Candidatus Poribacteria bacterium]|nr:MAG: hypothetical protein KatS3mg115_0370 [Candidatus Poribacteria bacterium]
MSRQRCGGSLLVALWLLAIWGTAQNADLPRAHRIQPGDRLRIVVLNRPELTQEVIVQDDGTIVYFVVGQVQAAGRTPEELAQTLREGLRSYLRDAQVIVVPVLRENEVYVGGMVRQPGRYTFQEGAIGLRQALALAGDLVEEGADLSRVVVVRPGEPPKTFDLREGVPADAIVQKGDLVYVPPMVRIVVTGNVGQPGVIWVERPVPVGYALARAGGITENGSLDRVVILRSSGEIEALRVPEEFWALNGGETPYLYNGDAVYVGNAFQVEEVNVLGYVRNPGAYRVRGPVSLGQAVALAGGLLPEEAAQKATVLRRDGSRQEVDLQREATTVFVYPGETVQVPRRFQINWSMVMSFISTAALVWSLVR